MYTLKKLNDVDKPAQIVHAIALGIELAMAIASLGLLIHALIVGDPMHRSGPILSSVLVFLMPFLLELILKKRFPFLLHIAFIIHATLAIFVGSALDLHHTCDPYDEIMHFLFGYMASLYIYYFLIAWRDFDKQKTSFIITVLFFASLGMACLWEVSEFTMDVFFGQVALGHPIPEIIAQGEALGLSGIRLSIYCLQNGVSVWDTVTDMSLHVGGSVLFIIQYIIERHTKRRLMLSHVRDDYMTNRDMFYNYVDDEVAKEITAQSK